MKKINYKKILLFTFLFLVIITWNLILIPLNLDEIWNYGFSHNIYKLLVPYRDFNMIITPFYPFLISIFFHIFGSSMLVFHIINALILVGGLYLLEKIIKDKFLLIFILLFIPLPICFPNYSLFMFCLLIVLIYLEINKGNDYLIGFILAISFLTKQSVGLFLILPSIYYLFDKKKIFKRIISFIIPNIIFLIYLIITNSLYKFFDLCLFGLFDFARENGHFNIFFVLTFIISIFIILYLIYKDRRNISNYYVLAFTTIAIPLFDFYHIMMMVLGVVLLVLMKYDIKFINIKLFTCSIIILLSIMYFKDFDYKVYPNNIKYFKYRYISLNSLNITKEVNDYLDNYRDKNIIYLCSNGYYFRLINDEVITDIDLINTGNYGYNGSDKLLKRILSIKNSIFVVDEGEMSIYKQTDKNVINYVINNGRKIDRVSLYDIYVLE